MSETTTAATEVIVCAVRSRYCGCRGCVVERDGRGYKVALSGESKPLHFERSELKFAAGAR